jgi:monofunctional biosynthetic peptidoglycan transglycosylase
VWYRVGRALGLALLGALLLLAAVVLALRWIDPPTSAFMLTARLQALFGGQHDYRTEYQWVSLEQISPQAAIAVIAAEDQQFPFHAGFDFKSIREAVRAHERGGKLRGASTITQQVAKNLFLWNGRSLVRKALEIPLALWINLVLPKRRIMEIYLNIAQWGPNGEFGAEAGARFAFNKPPRDLTLREAAELAAILPNPVRRSARLPGVLVRRLTGLYEARAETYSTVDACLRSP